jgi:hypothetical protein
VGAVSADRGSEFYARAAATGNARSSNVERRVAETVCARRRLLMSATR